MIDNALFTSNSDEWVTPQDVYDMLDKELLEKQLAELRQGLAANVPPSAAEGGKAEFPQGQSVPLTDSAKTEEPFEGKTDLTTEN